MQRGLRHLSRRAAIAGTIALAAMLAATPESLAATPKVTAPAPAKMSSWTISRIASDKSATVRFFKFRLTRDNASLKLVSLQDQWLDFAGRAELAAALGSDFKQTFAAVPSSFQYSDDVGYTYNTYLYNSKKRCIYHETMAEDAGVIDFGYKLPPGTYYVGIKVGSGRFSKSELEELKYYKLRYRFKMEPVAVEQQRIKRIVPGKKKLKVTWSTVGWKHMFENGKSAVYNQQIRISRKKSMIGARTLTTTRDTWLDTSCTVKKLKPRTSYYLQIRANVKVGGDTYWTQWSRIKHAKVK